MKVRCLTVINDSSLCKVTVYFVCLFRHVLLTVRISGKLLVDNCPQEKVLGPNSHSFDFYVTCPTSET